MIGAWLLAQIEKKRARAVGGYRGYHTGRAIRPRTPRRLATADNSPESDKEDQKSVELNHTIIPAKDKWVSAKFLADILNLEAGPEWGHFVPVKTANGVTLDFDTRRVSSGALRVPCQRRRVRRGVRPHPRSGRPLLRRSAAHQTWRDQPSARRSRRLFRRPQRSRDGNNHPPLRRPARARSGRPHAGDDAPHGRRTRSGVACMSMWSMSSDARASRIALIMVGGAAMQPAWPAPLTPRG